MPQSNYRAAVDDGDLVASSLDAVEPAVVSEFVVSHFHTGSPKFFVQLVDPQTRLRIDIFEDVARVLETAHHISDIPMKVLSKVDMTAHKKRTVGRASAARPVDIKHRRDLLALSGSVPDLPESWFVTEPYATDVNMRCERCQASLTPGFPLSEKPTIFDLLGYV